MVFVVIAVVFLMNVASKVSANRFVTQTRNVEAIKYAKTDFVKSVAAVIQSVLTIRLALTKNVKVCYLL